MHRMFHRSCCEECCDCCQSCCDGCGNGSCGGGAPAAVAAPTTTTKPNAEQMPAPKGEGSSKPLPKGDKGDKGVEPPLKPLGLDAAPTVVPNVTVESEKSPF
jgi:hypothetical protein